MNGSVIYLLGLVTLPAIVLAYLFAVPAVGLLTRAWSTFRWRLDRVYPIPEQWTMGELRRQVMRKKSELGLNVGLSVAWGLAEPDESPTAEAVAGADLVDRVNFLTEEVGELRGYPSTMEPTAEMLDCWLVVRGSHRDDLNARGLLVSSAT